MFVQPDWELQIFMHSAGLEQATSLRKRTLAAIPGKTNRKRGRNLRREASTQPALAWLMFLADNVLWTMTWSAHQYQMELERK